MSKLIRPAAALALVLAVFGLAPPAWSGPGQPLPPSPLFGHVADAYAAAQFQTTCDPTAKPGAVAFRDMVMTTYPGTGNSGISRPCDQGGTSEHKEGRGWDWSVSALDPNQKSIADTFLSWLLTTDSFGNAQALARRYGLMYVIWNRQIFKMYNVAAGWQPYSGPSPHTDHVHFSFSWDGARQLTTGWRPVNSKPNACRSFGDFDPLSSSAAPSVFRRANGSWYVKGRYDAGIQFGLPGDLPCALDYDGDGAEDMTVFRDGIWYVRIFAPSGISYGSPGDVPVAADYNGDGLTDLAVFRAGVWFVRGQADSGIGYGISEDVPVPGRYDSSATDLMAVYRPSTATWYIRGVNSWGIGYGQRGDVAAPADFTNNGADDIAVFRPTDGKWFIRGVQDGGVAFGQLGDLAVPADFNGDGKADMAVFRPSNATWYVDYDRNGVANLVTTYGQAGDIAVARRGSRH